MIEEMSDFELSLILKTLGTLLKYWTFSFKNIDTVKREIVKRLNEDLDLIPIPCLAEYM